MAAHGVFTRRYTSITIKDGAGTPLSRAVGPGPGDFTFSTVENGNYAALNDFQTWVCSFAMLLGRLEIFSILILFTPAFWRK